MPHPKFRLTIFEQISSLHEAAAAYIIAQANLAIEMRGRFVICLSGGDTPLKLYSLLAQKPFAQQMPWSDTFVFWGDERYVPTNDVRNNAHQAKVNLLDLVDIPKENIHSIPVQPTPEEAALQYAKDINDFFKSSAPRFDLILLGLGNNGHTASLFPRSEILDKKEASVRSFYSEDQKEYRITMTAPLINKAHHILFLVTGQKKAFILNAILNGIHRPDQFPAQLIQPVHGSIDWYIDAEAASELAQ